MPKKNPPVLRSVAIHQLRALAVELRKTPTVRDIEAAAKEKKCPPMSVIRQLFGGAEMALKAARLPPQRNQDFTEQELIDQLQDLARALGRPLTRKDVKQAGKAGTCARLVTFRRVFGNPSNAFRKAGVLKLGRFTREELIAQYRSLHKELGKLPTYEDIQRAAREGKCAGYKVFRSRCGTLEQLREAAGLASRERRRYTRQQLIDQLKKLAAKLGRTPFAKDLIQSSREHDCATIQTFTRYFGTYNKALTAAGMAPRPRNYSRGQLIQMLQELARRLGHKPTVKEVNQAKRRGECASAPTYDNYFGNMSTALRAANLENMPVRKSPRKPRKRQRRYTRDQMLEQLRRLAEKLGRVPTQRDVVEANGRRECAGVTTIALEFGTFRGALRAIGLDVVERPKEFTRGQLIEQLRQLTRELGRLPMAKDIDRAKSCSAPQTFIRRFGSLMEAREAAGLDDVLRDADEAAGSPDKFSKS